MNRNQQENHGPQRKASEKPQPEASRERHRQRRTESARQAAQPAVDERTPEQREALRHPPAQEAEQQDFEGDDVRTGRPRTR